MKLIICGGSGQVGTLLARVFHKEGDEVIVLSRNPEKAPWRVVPWDAVTLGDWTSELEGVDAVINLVGRSVNCRYGTANRRAIMSSRVLGMHLTQPIGFETEMCEARCASIMAAHSERTGGLVLRVSVCINALLIGQISPLG